ncbi:hypothetical protein MYK68_03745 [Gordonia sp. PP30]|uniref:hypothetical protein n=1 Tax=Gordonia sp. PP30 TaxID=2935861 RepID=UPI001FFF4982|nr:hypothetical protein [Gordonia sp. PP30]UQE75741.1 hypothetical protein MYK68_03745 [Gordonia sp. PP30]
MTTRNVQAMPKPATTPPLAIAPPSLEDVLRDMKATYDLDPVKAVRGQGFIKMLHKYIADDLRSRLTTTALRDGVEVKEEVKLFGSHKPKDADVAVIHPDNGVLLSVGVRSQMTSVGNNVLEYYQGIIGECISLQDRFPMAVYGYAYLHPLLSKKWGTVQGRKVLRDEHPDHARYALMYNAITGRDGTLYKDIRGVYDQFAYLVVDFQNTPLPTIRDDLVQTSVPLGQRDLRVSTFVDRLVDTFRQRNIWLDYFE